MAKATGIENANKIQAVINTLKLLEMPSSYDNVNHMLGIYNTLIEVRDDLAAPDAPAAKEEADDDGND